MRTFYLYILASRRRVLYVGVTNSVRRRLAEHRSAAPTTFVGRYLVYRLVYFEVHSRPVLAIHREKQIKRWRRAKKIALIERLNPDWRELEAPD